MVWSGGNTVLGFRMKTCHRCLVHSRDLPQFLSFFVLCLMKVFPYMEPQPDFMALKWHNRLFLDRLLVSADQLTEEESVIPNFK